MAEQSTGRPALACARGPQIVLNWLLRAPARTIARLHPWPARRAPRGRAACACALGALFLIVQLSCASSACAEPELNLTWSVPAACPDAAWARQRIAAQLARQPAAEVAQGVHASVTVEPRAAGFELRLRTVVAGAGGERTIHADACEELAQAAALIIALSVSEAGERDAPSNPPRPPPPPAPAPPPTQRSAAETLLALRADLLLDFGFFDRLGFGPALAIASQYGPWRTELGALWIAPQTVDAEAGSVEASLWAVRAGGCALFGSVRVQAGPCAGGEFGQTRAQGSGDLESGPAQRWPWIAVFAGARLSVGLLAKLALVLEADLSVRAVGPEFVTQPASGAGETLPIHAPAAAQLRANAGAELRF